MPELLQLSHQRSLTTDHRDRCDNGGKVSWWWEGILVMGKAEEPSDQTQITLEPLLVSSTPPKSCTHCYTNLHDVEQFLPPFLDSSGVKHYRRLSWEQVNIQERMEPDFYIDKKESWPMMQTSLFLFKGLIYLMFPISWSLPSGVLFQVTHPPTPMFLKSPAGSEQGILQQCANLKESTACKSKTPKWIKDTCQSHSVAVPCIAPLHTNLQKYEPDTSSFSSLQKWRP